MLTKAKFLLATIQSVAGTPEALVGTDAILTSGLTITPYGGNTVSRNFDRETLGASPQINVNPQVQLQFGVELAGSGTAGTAPGWSALARACGLEEAVNAGTSVVYTPRSTGYEFITAQYLRSLVSGDQQVHESIDMMGNMQINLVAGELPMLQFDNFMGAYSSPTAETAVVPDRSAFISPIAATKVNTPTLTLDSVSLCLQSLNINLNNQVVRQDRPGCAATAITDRAIGGTIVFKAPDLDVKDWFTEVESHSGTSYVALNVVHGTASGNIITIAAPQLQLLGVTEQDVNGEVFYSVPFNSIPTDAGDDDLSITLT